MLLSKQYVELIYVILQLFFPFVYMTLNSPKSLQTAKIFFSNHSISPNYLINFLFFFRQSSERWTLFVRIAFASSFNPWHVFYKNCLVTYFALLISYVFVIILLLSGTLVLDYLEQKYISPVLCFLSDRKRQYIFCLAARGPLCWTHAAYIVLLSSFFHMVSLIAETWHQYHTRHEDEAWIFYRFLLNS